MSDASTGAIAQLINGLDPGAVVTKFVVVAEVIDADGEPNVWTETHDGAMPWDRIGLLRYALWLEAAETAADDEDDD